MAILQKKKKNSSSGHESLWNVSITSCDVFVGMYHQSALFNSSTLFFSLQRVQMIASERASESAVLPKEKIKLEWEPFLRQYSCYKTLS